MAYVIIWILCAFICAFVAGFKGRNGGTWALLGLLFGPLGFLAVILLPSIDNPDQTRQKSPSA